MNNSKSSKNNNSGGGLDPLTRPESSDVASGGEDDFSDVASTAWGGVGLKGDGPDESPRLAKKESIAVQFARAFACLIIVMSTVGIAIAVNFYVKDQDKDELRRTFRDSSAAIMESVGSTLFRVTSGMDYFMVGLVSHAQLLNLTWPYVTPDDFPIKAFKALSITEGNVMGLYPKVPGEQRQRWEAYALDNDAWVQQTIAFQNDYANFRGRNVSSVTVLPKIHTNAGPVPETAPGPFFPNWLQAPLVPVFSPYNWDLGYEAPAEVQEVQQRRAVMGRTLNLPDLDNQTDVLAQNFYADWMSGLIDPQDDPSEPLLGFYYPVVTSALEGVIAPERTDNDDDDQNDPDNVEVVGVLALTLYWRDLMRDILPPAVNGVVVVISNDCGQQFTYQLNGGETLYLGRGDQHEDEHDEYAERGQLLSLVERFSTEGYSGVPISEDYCPYRMEIYPSDRFRRDFVTENPAYFTMAAILIFMFTSTIFCAYDFIAERRQRKLLAAALQSTAIISSLFPPVVRERLFFGLGTGEKKKKRKLTVETGKRRLQSYLNTNAEDDIGERSRVPEQTTTNDDEDRPIADLFSETTVMFADIAGFTAWSSIREPTQVFRLLEGLYGAFDAIANRRGVFKVETIGDSYVAVAGLPTPRPDHALCMAKFARDCREKMVEVTRDLEVSLGPDTGDLKLRIGLNSGPVTAGVLRGEKSRFQLFGDTVNFASRMESTGVVSKIQVSQATADLLVVAGKSHWLIKRQEMVQAKGKGTVQTYFVEPTAHGKSSHPTEEPRNDSVKLLDDKNRRLVEWNVDVLVRLIKQIVARREAVAAVARRQGKPLPTSAPTQISERGGTVLEEVREIIHLPDFDPEVVRKTRDASAVVVGPEVMHELSEYITTIATMYKPNPFHNFEHASHVTMSVVKLLSRIIAPELPVLDEQQKVRNQEQKIAHSLHDHTYGITSDPLTQFACVFSALIHDVEHPGIPNSQLEKENSPLVAYYKGKSMAEQNSVDLSWSLLMDPQYSKLRSMVCATQEEMKRFRQLVVNSVMATDIMDKDLKTLRNQRWDRAFQESRSTADSVEDKINRKATIVIEHLIQASDVAHTMQHWHIYRKWNERLFEELYRAYHQGRAAKNPADFWYKGEIGFFDFYIIPLTKKLSDCGVFGVSSDEYLNYAVKNREEWEHRGQEVLESMLNKFDVGQLPQVSTDATSPPPQQQVQELNDSKQSFSKEDKSDGTTGSNDLDEFVEEDTLDDLDEKQ